MLLRCECINSCPTAMSTSNSQVVQPANDSVYESTVADNTCKYQSSRHTSTASSKQTLAVWTCDAFDPIMVCVSV